ncbi:hypothetical protein BB561_001042 [Smittium simulii]|uniref:TRIP4/RQT4 C2HC5-type zinc finger domain-containing protein n=1 Tax=Smittium simulii TaxID=133385 RepID=A0A2T9YWE1_9FUNG|nr:hypothetical protein BB561_001042 [Smittium simulii]
MNESNIANFKITGKQKLSQLLGITSGEAEAIVDRFMLFPDVATLEAEIMDFLGFEEDALHLAAYFIENSSLWLHGSRNNQKMDINMKQSNQKQKNLTANNSDKKKLYSQLDSKNSGYKGKSKTAVRAVLENTSTEPLLAQSFKQKPLYLKASKSITDEYKNIEASQNHTDYNATQKDVKLNKNIKNDDIAQKNNDKSDRNKHKLQKNDKSKHKNIVRKKCECQALDHPLLTNCLNCGRILCVINGVGKCYGCDNRIESSRQQLINHIKSILSFEKNIDTNADKTAGLIYDFIDVKSRLIKETEKQLNKKALNDSKSDQKHFSRYSSKVGGEIYTTTKEWLPVGDTLKPKKSNQNVKEDYKHSENVSIKTYLEQEEVAQTLLSLEDKLKSLKINSISVISEIKRLFESENRKNRLLELDLISAQTTKIIDEKADFDIDTINRWMSTEEKSDLEHIIAQHKRQEEDAQKNIINGVRVLKIDLESKTVSFEREKSIKTPKIIPTVRNNTMDNTSNQNIKNIDKREEKKFNSIKFKGPEIVLPKANKKTKKNSEDTSLSATRGLAKSLMNKNGDLSNITEDLIAKIGLGA